MRAAVLVAVTVTSLGASACVLSVKVHAGIVHDQLGTAPQVGITLGAGMATETGGPIFRGGVATGTPAIGLETGVDYVWLGRSADHDGVHLGFSGGFDDVIAFGNRRGITELRAALLVVLIDRRHDDLVHDWFDSSRTAFALGVEGGAGLASFTDAANDEQRSLGTTLAITAELLKLSLL